MKAQMASVSAIALVAFVMATSANAGLAAPTGVQASTNICDEVVITWTRAPGAISYKIYDGPFDAFIGCTSQNNLIGETSDTSFTVPATPGVTRCYAVQAVYRDGVSPNSAPDNGNAKPLANIKKAPLNAGVCAGGSATFTVEATGADQYQWFKNGRPVGTDSPTLTLTNVILDDDGSIITVHVINACGPNEPPAATLSVGPAESLAPLHVTNAVRTVNVASQVTFCFTTGDLPCNDSKFGMGACYEPFDVAFETECDQVNSASATGSQTSTIGGAMLSAEASTDSHASGSCISGGASSGSTSRYEVTFTLDHEIEYTIAGQVVSTCPNCNPTTSANVYASIKLTNQSTGVVYSAQEGGAFNNFGTLPFNSKGALPPGAYTFLAEAKNGSSTGVVGNPTAASSFDVQFAVVLQTGDLDGDGAINGSDLGLLLAAWGPCADCPEDFNGDGAVDGADLGVLLAAWTG